MASDKRKEPMIGKGDRPGQADLDRRVGDMTVRDLVSVLGGSGIGPETIKPERIKPEHFKPEHYKPEWWKPEWIKPEAFKPEIFKEFAKPELTKPIEIDDLFDPILDGLSQDQLRKLSDQIQQRLR
jgi:hypothetical protein